MAPRPRSIVAARAASRAAAVALAATALACAQRSTADRPAIDAIASPLTPVPAGATQAADVAFVSIPPTRTLYVAQDGCTAGACSPSADCLTRSTACASVATAVARSQPGDEIRISWGANPYPVDIEDPAFSGTAAQPRFVRGIPSASGQKPVVVPGGSYVFAFPGSSYVVVDGLEIDCQRRVGTGVYVLAGGHHVAVRNSDIHDCTVDAVEAYAGAHDLLVENSELHHNQVRIDGGAEWGDANGVTINRGSYAILVRGNSIHDNSGDGVQCQGRVYPSDPASDDNHDITIEDNVLHDDFENAVDLKTCQRVTVRHNDMYGYDQLKWTDRVRCGGAAVIVHCGSTYALLDGNHIHDSGVGIVLGSQPADPAAYTGSAQDLPVSNVVIRRNRIHHSNQNASQTLNGVRYNCGDAIVVQQANAADVFHNTIDAIPHSGVRVGADRWYASPTNVRTWNNIVTNVQGRTLPIWGTYASDSPGGALDYDTRVPGLQSLYNLLFGAAGDEPLRLDGSQVSLATWQAHGLDTSDNVIWRQDPLFVTIPEYRLAATSPAIDTALADDGDAGASCGGGPDRGAVESDCDATPPGDAPPIWIAQPGTPRDEYAYAAATDSFGNVVVAGYTTGSLYGANPGGADPRDAFVAKYAATDGSRIWGAQLGGTGAESAYAVAVAADGSDLVYVAGSTTAAFGGQPYHGGARDAFLAQYDSSGVRRWLAIVGTTGDDVAYAVASDVNGDVYVAGSTDRSLGGPARGGLDAWVRKYSRAGTLLWSRQLGRNGDDVAYGLAMDNRHGHLWVTGSTTAAMTPTGGYLGGAHDAFVADLVYSTGAVNWVKNVGTAGDDVAWAAATDADADVLVAGSTTGAFSGFANAGGQDAFVAKYDASGLHLWDAQVGTASDTEAIYGVSTDADGNAYATGTTTGTLGSTRSGLHDILVAKWSPTGGIAWMRQLGTSADEVGRAVAWAPGAVYVAGGTFGSFVGTNAGGKDAVIAKYAE